MLSFKEFKEKLAAARAPRKTLSRTAQKRMRRGWKTRARAACGSFRWAHKHNSHPNGKLHGWKSSKHVV